MLLDSNILIYGADGAGEPRLDAILSRTDLFAASITRIETLGFHQLTETQRHWLEVAFGRMNILALDEAVADRAIALRRQRNMGLGDAIIAATALVHGIALVTRNTRDFQHVENLQLIDPFTPA
jgi:predicted nucleic acid-binding protein